MGLLQLQEGQGLPLLPPPPPDHHEKPDVHDCAEREVVPLDGDTWCDKVSAGWGALPNQQVVDGVAVPAELLHDGLAWQFTRSETHWEHLVDYEGGTQEEPCHHIPAQAGESHEDDVGEGPPLVDVQEAGAQHAQEDSAVSREQGSDDQILVKSMYKCKNDLFEQKRVEKIISDKQ